MLMNADECCRRVPASALQRIYTGGGKGLVGCITRSLLRPSRFTPYYRGEDGHIEHAVPDQTVRLLALPPYSVLLTCPPLSLHLCIDTRRRQGSLNRIHMHAASLPPGAVTPAAPLSF